MLTTLALVSAVAAAEPHPPQWDGWGILVADVASVSTVAVGIATYADGGGSNGVAVTVTGLALYTLLPPLIHLGNEHWKGAQSSFAWRLGLVGAAPLASAGIAYVLHERCSPEMHYETRDHCEDSRDFFTVLAGVSTMAIGAIVATTLDVTTFVRKPPVSATLLPRFDPSTRTAGMVVGAAF